MKICKYLYSSFLMGRLYKLSRKYSGIFNLRYNRHILSFKNIIPAFILIIMPLSILSQDLFMPENPLKGRIVFEQKGCINCHSISGEGGKIAPDLGEDKFFGSFLELASVMWNHAPDMLRQMRELDLSFPEFTRSEMIKLAAYLYYLRYLGEPGDLYRGKILVKEKGCQTCHSIHNIGGKSGPAFDSLAKYISPLYMAQALWNHGPEMEDKLQQKGLKLPKFEKGEIVDLSAYIRAASIGSDRDKIYMSPGNPQKGKIVFKEKECIKCHSVPGKSDDIGADLSEFAGGLSVSEIAAIMWNHSSAMRDLMKDQNIEWPKFEAKQMADLIAYLYFIRFEDKKGDAQKGKIIFSKKRCSHCHGENAKENNLAPDLSQTITLLSSIDMVQIMWNHAPDMEERISEIDLLWPELSRTEMIDLYAYLRTIKKN